MFYVFGSGIPLGENGRNGISNDSGKQKADFIDFIVTKCWSKGIIEFKDVMQKYRKE